MLPEEKEENISLVVYQAETQSTYNNEHSIYP